MESRLGRRTALFRTLASIAFAGGASPVIAQSQRDLPGGRSPQGAANLDLGVRRLGRGPTEYITAFAFSPDGTMVVGGGRDTSQNGFVDPFSRDQDGKSRVVTTGSNLTLKVWDALAGREIRVLGEHPAPILAVAYSPDGKLVASAGVRGYLPNRVVPPVPESEAGRPKRFSGPGLTTHWAGGIVKIWDVSTGRLASTLAAFDGPVVAIGFERDGVSIRAFDSTFAITSWNVGTGERISSFPPPVPLQSGRAWPGPATFARPGTRLVSVSSDPTESPEKPRPTIEAWDLATLRHRTIPVDESIPTPLSIAFHPDGRRFVVGGFDNSLQTWDFEAGKVIGAYRAGGANDLRNPDVSSPELGVVFLGFSSDGAWLASGTAGGVIRVWNVADGRLMRRLEGPGPGSIRDVVFLPKGLRVISGANLSKPAFKATMDSLDFEPLTIWDAKFE